VFKGFEEVGTVYFNPLYFVFVGPFMLLGWWAQRRVKTTYARASQEPAQLSGAAAARHILDESGLNRVEIQQVPGTLSDHYDPRAKVLRLSHDVYHGRTLAAVGIAAHEAGHAIQDAVRYAPLVVRNAAVPVANVGSSAGLTMFMIGMMMNFPPLIWLGVILFSCVVFFQLVNLPVEFDASNRAKALLVDRGIVPAQQMSGVNSVLNAAALTYVAATLQAAATLAFYVFRATQNRRRY
jgi:Zn-dependent membrane protease YugP